MLDPSPAVVVRNLSDARHFVEGGLGGADPTAFAEMVHPDVTVEFGLKPARAFRGAAEYGTVLACTLGQAFTNCRLEIQGTAALADGRVMVRFEAPADDTGDLDGVPATGRRFTFRELHLVRSDQEGRTLENRVAGLHPLWSETSQEPAMAPLPLGEESVSRVRRQSGGRRLRPGRACGDGPTAPTWPIGKTALRALAPILAEQLAAERLRVGTVAIADPVGDGPGEVSAARAATAFLARHRGTAFKDRKPCGGGAARGRDRIGSTASIPGRVVTIAPEPG